MDSRPTRASSRVTSWLNQFRFAPRTARRAFSRARPTRSSTYTAPVVSVNGTDTPGLRASSLGNSALKPETTTEFEGGFDTRVLGNRVNID